LTKGKEKNGSSNASVIELGPRKDKPDLQESAQGVIGKHVQATLMNCHSMNVCRKLRLQPFQQMRVQARTDCSLIA